MGKTLKQIRAELRRRNPVVVLLVKRDIAFQTGRLIERLRIQNKLTQQQLANKIGAQQPSIARAERGLHMSTRLLQRIADALDVTIEVRVIATKTKRKRGTPRPKKPHPTSI